MSAKPSPFTSPAATKTPPVKPTGNAMKSRIIWNDLPSKTRTSGPPPGPAPQMMSGTPSPLTSPTATRTPPVKVGVKASKLAMSAPVWAL